MNGTEDKLGTPAPDDFSAGVTHAFRSADGSSKGAPRGFQPPEIIRLMSPEERDQLEKKLIRKIDIRILPMIVVMYILNYIDRNNIASARFAGLEDDLKLNSSGTQFSMAIWGVISAATAGCHSFGGLLAARFFLGFVEAAYFPGCLYYLSCWYTRKELGVRTTYLYAGSLISGAFSGLIAAGITGNMDGTRGLRAWRWLFIIEGTITVAIAIVAFFILPDFPRTTKWLNKEEMALAVWRLEEDIGQDDWVNSQEQTLWHGFKLALEDVKTWVLLVMLFGNIAAASVTNFFPTVVATLKYKPVVTLLLTAPPYVLGVITTFATAWHADRTGERFYHVSIPLCLAMVTFIISAATTNIAARYVAIMLMIPGLYSGFTTALAWISNTLPRPPAKRAAALAFINAVANSTSIYASYLYPKSAAPEYTGAFIHNCVMAAVAIFAAFVLKRMLVRLNNKLDRGETVEGAVNAAPGEAVEHGFRFLV
ncbi:putativetransporter [Metarhizium anisopliae]